jgi:predicted ATP-dependent endonuclease of OLD family
MNSLQTLEIDPKPHVDDFFHLINEEVFIRSQKKLEFVGDVKFTQEWLNKVLEGNEVLDDLRERLKAMVSDNTYRLNREFPDLLESKVGRYFASRLRSQILQHVEFVEDSPQWQAIFRLNDGRVLMPDQLSTGEKQILIILFTALILKFRMLANPDLRHVLIIDEPENSLHLKWQKSLISYIRRLNDNVQIIIATHAPAIIKKGYMENTVEMNQIKSVMEG